MAKKKSSPDVQNDISKIYLQTADFFLQSVGRSIRTFLTIVI